jgi:Bacterial protein of unknown function (DUF839)
MKPFVDRRSFLRNSVASAAALSFAPGLWRTVMSAPAVAGSGPYGPLGAVPDANGFLLPPGFSSRVIARSGQPVGLTTFVRPVFPDGSATFPLPGGGWILVTNSENPPPFKEDTFDNQDWGGASAIAFGPDGTIVGAYSILENTRSNCAGSATPWGTYLSCEEFDVKPGLRGQVWECDPLGAVPAVARPALGCFMHEAATVDPARGHVYLTEDRTDGLFYRFTPTVAGDLSAGVLEAAVVDGSGGVTWATISDPVGSVDTTRAQGAAAGATSFDGGEGCYVDIDVVYFSTKNDNRIWVYDIVAETMTVLYDGAGLVGPGIPGLRGVDSIAVSPFSGDVFVAEDGGDMEVVVITPEGDVAPLLRMVGPQHGTDGLVPGGQPDVGPLPHVASEISGLAFSPNGSRLYVNSQRGFLTGVTYEVSGPFRITR